MKIASSFVIMRKGKFGERSLVTLMGKSGKNNSKRNGSGNRRTETTEGLTEKQMREADKMLEGVPYMNIGALFMPPIWGAGHGQFIPILFYPIWLFCDNLFYALYTEPSVLSAVASIIVFVVTAAVTVAYGRLSQVRGLQRALDAGKTKAQYLKTERTWAIAMIVVAVVMLALATWFNLFVRPTL